MHKIKFAGDILLSTYVGPECTHGAAGSTSLNLTRQRPTNALFFDHY